MPELHKLTDEQLINIKNEILNDVDHNKPKMKPLGSQAFLDAMTIGTRKFSNSKLKDIVTDSMRD